MEFLILIHVSAYTRYSTSGQLKRWCSVAVFIRNIHDIVSMVERTCSGCCYRSRPTNANIKMHADDILLLSPSVVIFTARAYARAVLGVVILSVRLSVCHTRAL